jgi:hypothetical protein
MPKIKRKTKSIRYRYQKNKRTRNRRYRKGGTKETVTCCICGKNDTIEDTLIPSECYMKNGKAAHRICKDCWWNKFALEGTSHKCPGCIKGLPLTRFKKEPPVFVDLTKD